MHVLPFFDTEMKKQSKTMNPSMSLVYTMTNGDPISQGFGIALNVRCEINVSLTPFGYHLIKIRRLINDKNINWCVQFKNKSSKGKNIHFIAVFNTLRPKQMATVFTATNSNENVWISVKISLKFVPGGPINNIQVLVQIMAWRRPGDELLFDPMMIYWRIHATKGLNELICCKIR